MAETVAGLRINLGSGQRRFRGWVNVDANERWSPDVWAEWNSMPMFETNEAEIVVAHHVIEHVGLGEFASAIHESWRVLKPGGSLIVTTPDLDALTKAYVRGRMPNGELFTDYQFCVNLYGAYMDSELDRHKWLYNGKTLHMQLANAAPWKRITSFDWRAIEGADIAKDWWILGVEAIK